MSEKEIVLVTGCSNGIGRELCKTLSARGYRVIATARNLETIKELPSLLKLKLDVTDRQSIYTAINEIRKQYKKINILINNAGCSVRGAVEEVDLDSVKNIFDINVLGVIRMVQACLPLIPEDKSGRIINIGSISGRFVQPVNGAYCATKYAVEAITETLRIELRKKNIQVSVVEPGPVKTGFFPAMEKRSEKTVTNKKSRYKDFYLKDSERKENQKTASPVSAAEEIARILTRKRLKIRYKVCVPFAYRVFMGLPDSLRENIMS